MHTYLHMHAHGVHAHRDTHQTNRREDEHRAVGGGRGARGRGGKGDSISFFFLTVPGVADRSQSYRSARQVDQEAPSTGSINYVKLTLSLTVPTRKDSWTSSQCDERRI